MRPKPTLRWHRGRDGLAGATQMDADRALLRAATQGQAWLRFYSWHPPAISLGFHQATDQLDAAALARRGIDVVERPTGGAAVLHADEITYALAAPLTTGFGATARDIYCAVADAFVAAFAACDVAAQCSGSGRPSGFSCFGSIAGHEIAVDGKKLVGSALRRTRHAFLIHGSILTGPGHLDLVELVRDPEGTIASDARQWLAARTTDLGQLGVAANRQDQLVGELARALARAGSCQLEAASSLPD